MSGPRIIGGAWRGRVLAAPVGEQTRPTAARVRQALFDMLAHADWADGSVEGAVLDVFAGSGALGLEALSRGAQFVTFIECEAAAGAAIRRNIALCGAEARARMVVADACRPPPGRPHALVLLDPPYGRDLVWSACSALAGAGWVAPGALVVAELGRAEPVPGGVTPLVERTHGAARLVAWRV